MMTENGISSSHPKVIPDGISLVFSLILSSALAKILCVLVMTKNTSAVAAYTIHMYKYTKIQGPQFQRTYIIARYRKSDLNGTSFQSLKINRMLITRLICIQ